MTLPQHLLDRIASAAVAEGLADAVYTRLKTPIGTLTVLGNYCWPTETTLVCAAADSVKAWRYRAD